MGYEITSAGHRTRETQRVTLVRKITGDEPITTGRSSIRWIPTTMSVTYERDCGTGRPWSAWRMLSGVLLGVNLRADGSPGANREFRMRSWALNEVPDVIGAELRKMASEVDRYGVDQPDPDAVDLDG